VLYELCTLRRAFDGASLPALVVKILRGRYPPVPPRYGADLRRLVDSMLRQNPKVGRGGGCRLLPAANLLGRRGRPAGLAPKQRPGSGGDAS
jgi:hypothetical protein